MPPRRLSRLLQSIRISPRRPVRQPRLGRPGRLFWNVPSHRGAFGVQRTERESILRSFRRSHVGGTDRQSVPCTERETESESVDLVFHDCIAHDCIAHDNVAHHHSAHDNVAHHRSAHHRTARDDGTDDPVVSSPALPSRSADTLSMHQFRRPSSRMARGLLLPERCGVLCLFRGARRERRTSGVRLGGCVRRDGRCWRC